MSNQIEDLREQIDNLDVSLVSLLNEYLYFPLLIGIIFFFIKKRFTNSKERALLTLDINNVKKELAKKEMKVNEHDSARELEVQKLNNGPLPNNTLISIFREIVSASLSISKDVKVSFLGPRGTYSHQAASSRFGDSVLYSKQRTIADVFRSVEKKESTYGVVPFENSTHGTVTQTIDELIRTPVKVRADLYLPIHHQFLSKSSDLSEITKIYSHPEALGQCSKWLNSKMRNVEKIPVSSTSHAAELASKELGAGAICSLVCADIYGLKVLDRDVEDIKDNTTRFFVIGQSYDGPTGHDKTVFSFTVDHRQPGALCNALAVFKQHNINITKIDSRPSHQYHWHYIFVLEIEGHVEDEPLKEAFKELDDYCVDINIIGSYPRAEEL